MKVVTAPMALRRSPGWSLGWIQGALFAGAILMLGYCAYVTADAWIFQRQEDRDFTRLIEHPAVASQHEASPAIAPAIAMKGLIGRIDIGRLGLSVMVMEGTSAHILRRSVGHIEGTALPGEDGNVGLSGHRDTFFRPLRNIRRDDIIVLTTLAGQVTATSSEVTTPGRAYRYRVVSMRVVSPDDVSVLNATGSDVLTLVTCYPFYFVGPAPDRFIVRAERVI